MKQVHSDEAIVAAFVSQKDERLFAEIYNRYQLKVFQSCLQFLHDPEEALDQTQEIFCKVYTRLHTFRAEAKFSTWLFVLTRYHCLSVLDTLKRRTFVSLDSIGEMTSGYVQQEELTLDERWFQAERTLDQLSVQDQQLLRRRYLANKDVATLANEAHVSVSAMKMRLKRARDQARAIRHSSVTN
ncbi:RNA polymerase sigma factor [Fibrella forsythiae]|uniref:Sigma-70 family RNA polymerase sigma factor n=1 Tax=Fibrella forsythiae TaxID=2817061 RepID=A0ABS3JGI4_9BACT|nr:sigma-70 family RNA polymerase sigma factor [Fibrella forsythiae]MBO0948002.1 sigma-70 family RNA polymerase sigma factor [Fibrella forsythiae]